MTETTPPWPVIPPEPKLPYRLWFGGMEHHATALGYICFTYAILEGVVNRHIEFAVPCLPDARRVIVDASGTSLENRCNLLIKLCSLRNPGRQWFDDFEALLNRVKNELAPERNRLVHDEWVAGPTIRQWDQRTFLRQPQARKPKTIAPPAEPERSLESLWDLVRRIQEVSVWLGRMSIDYAMWLQTGQLPKSPRPPTPERKDSAPKARSQGAKKAKKPRPRSSQGKSQRRPKGKR